MEFKDEINNECAFNLKNKGICSDPYIINKIKELVVETKNVPPKNDKKLFDDLKEKYNCKSESCVLTQPEIKEFIPKYELEKNLQLRFKPKGPRNSFNWLSNFDIDDVLEQIQKKYTDKKFYHINFQMRDFEKMGSELARLDFYEKYKQNYRTFGTIINTDYSTGQGIHWFAIFGDFLDNNNCFTIEYFNSSGEPPLDEILIWMKKVKHEWDTKFDKNVKDIIVSNIHHQTDNHSCGAYSLYYIISRLEGIPYKHFRENRIDDKVMHEFRKYLFRDEQ